MKKKILFLLLIVLVLALGAAFYFLDFEEEEVVVDLTYPAFQCRGKIISENLKFQNRLKVLDMNFNENEIISLIDYQLMFGFANFQYMPLETPLQNLALRARPQVQVLEQKKVSYGKDIKGKIKLPAFLEQRRQWPEEISSTDQALDVLYEVEVPVDFCVANSTDELPFYFPLDPLYAYYFLAQEHWGEITNREGEKSIVLNRCQNYHLLFNTDEEFSEHYWAQWNPTKRGKEAHTDFYECPNWLEKGIDYQEVHPERHKIDPIHYKLPSINLEKEKTIILKYITSLDEKEKKSFYEVAVEEILNGKDFLETLPYLTTKDKKLFKWLGEVSHYIKSPSKIALLEKEERLRFSFTALLGEKKTNFELIIGEDFNREGACDIGLSYVFDFVRDPLMASSHCEEEFYYIPQSSLFYQFLSSKEIEGRVYFLTGWPSLADEATGGYLLDYIAKRESRENYLLSAYLEEEGREDAFITLPHFPVILEEK